MSFYAYNITAKWPDREPIIDFLNGRSISAFVSPVVNGFIVLSCDSCESMEGMSELASAISYKFDCPCLSVQNWDDALLRYSLHNHGVLADDYNSCPDYGGSTFPPRDPSGGNTRKL